MKNYFTVDKKELDKVETLEALAERGVRTLEKLGLSGEPLVFMLGQISRGGGLAIKKKS